MLYSEYIEAYESGDWTCSAPPGWTGGWDREAWIAWIFGVRPEDCWFNGKGTILEEFDDIDYILANPDIFPELAPD